MRTLRRVAVDRDNLQRVAAEDAAEGRGRREGEALERSFRTLEFRVGKRTWKRADLHARF